MPNVQGDEVQKQRIASMLNLLNLLRLVMANKLNNNQLSQVPKSPHSKVMLMTDGELTMPDMTGWTKEDVLVKI